MTGSPFPDEPNAEVCAHTGGRANAVVGRYGRNRVSGWYGSSVIDGGTMLVVDPDFPEGPICDAALRAAIASGRIFDPAPVLEGDVHPADLPGPVVAGMLRIGMDRALVYIAVDSGEAPVVGLPSMRRPEDDPLGLMLISAQSRLLSVRGVDLEAMGAVVATLHKARGRPFGPCEREAAIATLVDRFAEQRELREGVAGEFNGRQPA